MSIYVKIWSKTVKNRRFCILFFAHSDGEPLFLVVTITNDVDYHLFAIKSSYVACSPSQRLRKLCRRMSKFVKNGQKSSKIDGFAFLIFAHTNGEPLFLVGMILNVMDYHLLAFKSSVGACSPSQRLRKLCRRMSKFVKNGQKSSKNRRFCIFNFCPQRWRATIFGGDDT